MPTQTVDYRSARVPSAIRDPFAHRAALRATAAITMIAIGMPLLFIGPLVLATVFWIATAQLFGYYPWSWFATGFILLLIPLLFHTERKTRGSFLSDTIAETGGASTASNALMLGGELGMLIAFAANPRVASSGLVEIFLTGPRLVLDGIDRRRGARALRHVNMDRAVALAAALLASDQGKPIEELHDPDEMLAEIDAPLAYLVFYDWIGVSNDRKRVWLLTDARRELTQV